MQLQVKQTKYASVTKNTKCKYYRVSKVQPKTSKHVNDAMREIITKAIGKPVVARSRIVAKTEMLLHLRFNEVLSLNRDL